jgi:hypothetical protein
VRLRLLLFVALLSLALTAPVTPPNVRTAETSQLSQVSQPRQDVDLDVEAQRDRWYTEAASAPVVVQLPVKKRRNEGSEGNTRAQAPQEAASYEPGSIETLICSVFGDACPRAIRIARCESGLNPNARNRSGAAGLFQLLGHADLYEAHGWTISDWADPFVNATVAFDLYLASGWSPWVCR